MASKTFPEGVLYKFLFMCPIPGLATHKMPINFKNEFQNTLLRNSSPLAARSNVSRVDKQTSCISFYLRIYAEKN